MANLTALTQGSVVSD